MSGLAVIAHAIDPEENASGEELAVTQDGVPILFATRYDLPDKYSSTYWHVNPNQTKTEHFVRLVQFYHQVKTGNFSQKAEFPPGIFMDDPEKLLNLELLEHDGTAIPKKT
ncbi:MAG: hypothetical protein Q7K43_06865 [Candidatus Woesearchaeota archaeon]|nr:hypothetical protein [Candidatus Woesearchaeota archaeon]